MNQPLPPVSEQTQQIEEQVDEVEIEAECAQQRHLLSPLSTVFLHEQHPLDLLRVVSCQTYKHGDTHITQNQVEHCALDQKEIHQCGDNHTDEGHQRQFANRGQVGLRGVSDECHNRKCASRDQEDARNRRHRIGKEDKRHGYAVDNRVDYKQERG